MRGEILGYSAAEQKGIITGENGQRYSFTQTEWKEVFPLTKGMKVDFNPIDNQATEIFSVTQQPSASAYNEAGQSYSNNSAQAQMALPHNPLTFTDAVKRCFKKYFDCSGRATRKEFWFFDLFRILISLFLLFLQVILAFLQMSGENSTNFFLVLRILILLVFFVPGLMVFIRRMHDIGKSGWNYFWGLLPIIGWIYLLILYCRRTQPQENQYGKPYFMQ